MNMNDWLEGNRKIQLESFLASLRDEKLSLNKAARMEKSRKEKSWTRQTYEASYRLLRRGFLFDHLHAQMVAESEVFNAAEYSYQAKDYEGHNWSTEHRYSRFLHIKSRILTEREDYLF